METDTSHLLYCSRLTCLITVVSAILQAGTLKGAGIDPEPVIPAANNILAGNYTPKMDALHYRCLRTISYRQPSKNKPLSET